MGTSDQVQESADASATPATALSATEPAKIEPAKLEPATLESAKPETTKSETTKPETTKPEPARPEPFRIGLTTATPRIEPAARPSASERPEAPKPQAETADTAAAAPTAASARARSGVTRFALLAASIAVAAAVGSFAGSMAASGIAHLLPAASAAAPPTATADATKATQQLTARISNEYAALKGNFDSLMRSANAQFAKLGERLDRAERAQADPAAKLAKIAEAVDRLEKHGAASAPETTGSIAAQADAKAPDKPLEGWVLHDVKRGRALLESRYGGMFEVSQGGFLPGVGRVQEIKRQDGRWVIVTSRGTITSYY
jgi:hypothetical protein